MESKTPEKTEENGKKPKKSENKPEKKPKIILKDSGTCGEIFCFEAVTQKFPIFLCYRYPTKDWFKLEKIPGIDVHGGDKNAIYVPKTPQQYPYMPYGIYGGEIPAVREMFDLILKEFSLWIDTADHWKILFAICVLLTYHQEKLVTVSARAHTILQKISMCFRSSVLRIAWLRCRLKCDKAVWVVNIKVTNIEPATIKLTPNALSG